MKTLVIGARSGSLGQAVMRHLEGSTRASAGISGEEMLPLDVMNAEEIRYTIRITRPDNIVCTVGMNPGAQQINDPDLRLSEEYERVLAVNAIAPIAVLRAFQFFWEEQFLASGGRRNIPPKHFVAISSNSARIPRSQSLAYCASKAALSMSLRVAARGLAALNHPVVAYGYEPGLLDGTPMTKRAQFGNATSLHRMPNVGPNGLSVDDLARAIVFNLEHGNGRALNGALIPFDAGEI